MLSSNLERRSNGNDTHIISIILHSNAFTYWFGCQLQLICYLSFLSIKHPYISAIEHNARTQCITHMWKLNILALSTSNNIISNLKDMKNIEKFINRKANRLHIFWLVGSIKIYVCKHKVYISWNTSMYIILQSSLSPALKYNIHLFHFIYQICIMYKGNEYVQWCTI